jgi:Zn-dependent protease
MIPKMWILLFPFFLYSVILHEVAHGIVALWNGDPTAKLRRRITLNPIPHIDIWGLFFFVVSAISGFGFGWAKPVPVNPQLFRNKRRGMIQVALAGVSANLLIAALAIVTIRILAWFLPAAAESRTFVSQIDGLLFLLAELNVVLAVFNLVPIPPLDGSRVVRELLPKEMAEPYSRLEPFGLILLLGFIYLGGFSVVYNIAEHILRGALLLIGMAV